MNIIATGDFPWMMPVWEGVSNRLSTLAISPTGKLTYHIRKMRDGGQWFLEVVTTVDDPTYYTRPWRFARTPWPRYSASTGTRTS